MSSPNIPNLTDSHIAPYSGPDGVGYLITNKVVTGPPLPPPRARVLLGGNVPLYTAAGGSIVRRYYGQHQAGDASRAVNDVRTDAGNMVHTLLSVGPGLPQSTAYDSTAMEAFRPALEADNALVIPWHEPDNTAPDPATWRAFYEGLAKQFPKATLVPTLMGITYGNGKASNWLTGLSRAAFIGADPYIHDGQTVGGQYDPARKYAEAAGKQLILCETGLLAGKPPVGTIDYQSVGLAAIHAYVGQYPSVFAVAYWSNVGKQPWDWTLSKAGIATYQGLLQSAPFSADS